MSSIDFPQLQCYVHSFTANLFGQIYIFYWLKFDQYYLCLIKREIAAVRESVGTVFTGWVGLKEKSHNAETSDETNSDKKSFTIELNKLLKVQLLVGDFNDLLSMKSFAQLSVPIVCMKI
jgi:hypothetical protein